MNYLYNAIQTPDGTILESKHRHDYRTHIDKVTGEEYMVDGGGEYLRRNVNKIPATELSIPAEGYVHEKARRYFRWGVRGRTPETQYDVRWVKLEDLGDNHIEAILETQKLSAQVFKLFEHEMIYRQLRGNTVPESNYSQYPVEV